MKRFICTALLISLCITFCSCALSFLPQERYLSPKITRPESYLITYEEDDGSVISEGYDSDGNIYHRYNGVEYLYLMNPKYKIYNTRYDEYQNESRGFVKTSGDKPVMGGNGECEMAIMNMYAKYNLKPTKCIMEKNANETIADRDCYSYTIVVNQSSAISGDEKYTYDVLIDIETGFCLKSVCTNVESDIEDVQVPFGFWCTEFTTNPESFANLIKE